MPFYYEEFDRWYGMLCRYGLREECGNDSSEVGGKIMHAMASYLNEKISVLEYCGRIDDLLDKPLFDKQALRILQSASLDVEHWPDELGGVELKKRVAQWFGELALLGYRASE